jgi:hypothetical protein
MSAGAACRGPRATCRRRAEKRRCNGGRPYEHRHRDRDERWAEAWARDACGAGDRGDARASWPRPGRLGDRASRLRRRPDRGAKCRLPREAAPDERAFLAVARTGAAVAGAAPAPPDPAGGPELGDIAIAFETCDYEAAEAGLPFDHHVTHLLVHGTLHLLGYDHERDEDAEVMERIEVEVLASLGIPNPY